MRFTGVRDGRTVTVARLFEDGTLAPVAEVDDFYADLGLAKLISPLRLRGMSAMLTRIKRRLRDA